MQKSAIILESSYLAANIYKTILGSADCRVDLAFHFEDIDVLMRERRYDTIIIGSGLFSDEKWAVSLKHNPGLEEICKIFIGFGDIGPSNFNRLRRPFKPNQLIRLAGFQVSDGTFSSYDDEVNGGAGSKGNRRIFERKSRRLNVCLDDEKNEPIISLVAADVSYGGMFLEAPLSFSIGSLAFLSIDTGAKKIPVSVQVVRSTPKGIGVRFIGLPKEAADFIASF
ncbi:MAG: PilZ domain-containing protein [Deltaproteobacteria bacterium]|nr:PilZ domain-containing protein [Deltaproteobacteria bacterium]